MSTWNIDAAHSEIAFKIKHLVISSVRGTFNKFSGSGTSTDDTFENATINFTAEINSIDTNNENRDEHLRGSDFFNAAEFPTLAFTSTSFKKTNGAEFELIGDLTMKGVAKPVSLVATLNGITKGMNGKRVASFDVTGTINRADFGLAWNVILEAGGLTLGEDIKLDITIEISEE